MLYLYAAVAVASAVAAGSAAWQVQNWRYGAKEHEREVAHQREVLRKTEKIDTSAVRHETAKTRIETEIVEIEREVVRVVKEPFYVDAPACLDDDGMRLVNEAAGHPAAPASLPASSVQRP
jgi:hypothetical protein